MNQSLLNNQFASNRINRNVCVDPIFRYCFFLQSSAAGHNAVDAIIQIHSHSELLVDEKFASFRVTSKFDIPKYFPTPNQILHKPFQTWPSPDSKWQSVRGLVSDSRCSSNRFHKPPTITLKWWSHYSCRKKVDDGVGWGEVEAVRLEVIQQTVCVSKDLRFSTRAKARSCSCARTKVLCGRHDVTLGSYF